jgi:hypothetical protein
MRGSERNCDYRRGRRRHKEEIHQKCHLGHPIKEGEIGGECSMCGDIRNGCKILRDSFGDLSVDVRIILKLVF